MRASSQALITGAVQFDTRLILTFFASKGLVGSSPSYNLSVNGLSTSTLGPHLPNHWWVSLSFSISGDTFTTQPQTNERVRFIYTFFQTTSWPEYFFFIMKSTRWLKQFFFSFLNPVARFLPNKGLKTLTLLLRAHLLELTIQFMATTPGIFWGTCSGLFFFLAVNQLVEYTR